MPAALSGGWARFKTTLAGFSLAQRTIALIGVAVLILGIVALTTWASKPAYTPLFSGLSASDASTIVEQLRTNNVPYELTNGGATVLVPEENVYDERLAAAAAGLPSSSTGGYSLLDTMGVTTSEFQQSITYKRALEGELAKTISAMKGVGVASVQLAIPEESVFIAEKQNPTASVFVQTDNGVTLNTDQVNAIVHLTSASIEGMDALDVAVIDANGTVLSAVGTGTTGSGDSQATDYEQRVRTTVQAMLDRIVGAGNSTVAVAATVSSESADVVTETFGATPDVPALTESVDTETFTGTGEAAAGVLGEETAVADAAGDTGNYESESTTRNNAVNKVTESRTIPAGAIARQTISVAINTDAAENIDQTQVENLVMAAAGIQVDRGDSVAVRLVGFNTVASDDAAAALLAAKDAADADRWAELVRTAIIALAVVVPLIFALAMILRRSRKTVGTVLDTTEEVGDATEILPMMFTPGGSGSGAARDAAIAAGIARPTATAQALHRGTPQSGFMGDGVSTATAVLPTAGMEPTAADLRNADISNFAASDPKKTAEYLRRLMDERRS